MDIAFAMGFGRSPSFRRRKDMNEERATLLIQTYFRRWLVRDARRPVPFSTSTRTPPTRAS